MEATTVDVFLAEAAVKILLADNTTEFHNKLELESSLKIRDQAIKRKLLSKTYRSFYYCF